MSLTKGLIMADIIAARQAKFALLSVVEKAKTDEAHNRLL